MNSEVVVVLHQTKIPENIGSVCRVIGNLGLSRLVLIDRICEVDIKAEAMAVGCQELLNSRREYRTWNDFLKNENGLRIAFSARKGKERENNQADAVFGSLLQTKASTTETVDEDNTLPKTIYLIFGREDSGLSADDLLNCHQTCALPVYGDYKSLNLSHAVFLAGFLWQQKVNSVAPLSLTQRHSYASASPASTSESIRPETNSSSTKPMHKEPSYKSEFDSILREWLESLGFDLSAPKTNAFRVMKKLLLKNQPTEKEIKILHSVLQQNVRKLKEMARF